MPDHFPYDTEDLKDIVAACAAPEPFLPAGARLWGSTTVGVRCTGSLFEVGSTRMTCCGGTAALENA